jgi:ribonucleoside-diphosphate reductase alpha chain
MPISSTNPCSEQPLFAGRWEDKLIAESCNLGSINLTEFVEIETGIFRFVDLEQTVRIAIRFLDGIIDKNDYPIMFRCDQCGKSDGIISTGTNLTRKIGLGVCGFHDMLIKLGVPYDSDDAIEWAGRIMSLIQKISHEESEALGHLKGCYPLFNHVSSLPGIPQRRNLTTTTAAPPGTLSRLLNGHTYSTGIEPAYALSITSHIVDTIMKDPPHPLFVDAVQALNIGYDAKKAIIAEVERTGSCQHIKELPISIKKLFKIAKEIPVKYHIGIQAEFQKHIDSAISKTINFDEKATWKDVKDAYISAYENGLKSVAIYIDGSRTSQVLHAGEGMERFSIEELRIDELQSRSKVLDARNIRIRTACCKLWLTATEHDNQTLEIFKNTTGSGGCGSLQDGICVSNSVSIRFIDGLEEIYERYGIAAIEEIFKTYSLRGVLTKMLSEYLGKIHCKACIKTIERQAIQKASGSIMDDDAIVSALSCPHAISQALKLYQLNIYKQTKPVDDISDTISLNIPTRNVIDKLCPSCHIATVKVGNCYVCGNCGHSSCGG